MEGEYLSADLISSLPLDGGGLGWGWTITFIIEINEELDREVDRALEMVERGRIDKRRLLETYNDRVDAAETDKSMLIEIAENLWGTGIAAFG